MKTEINMGVTGAKRQSWSRANPRDTLLRLIRENEGDSEDDIRVICWERLKQDVSARCGGVDASIIEAALDNSQLRTTFEYWFANNYRSLIHEEPQAREQRMRQRQVVAEEINKEAAQLASRIETVIKKRLLGMIMPTGKTLRDSTREELLAMSDWTAAVATKLQPGQTVGEAGLTEDQLHELYPGAKESDQ